MDLKTFVSESLQQIIEGVIDAQSKVGGENVNAEQSAQQIGGNVILAGAYGLFTRVDFDVAISAESKGKGGGSLKVMGFGIGADGELSRGSVSRAVFSVPVRLPYGDQELANQYEKSAPLRARNGEPNGKMRGGVPALWFEARTQENPPRRSGAGATNRIILLLAESSGPMASKFCGGPLGEHRGLGSRQCSFGSASLPLRRLYRIASGSGCRG